MIFERLKTGQEVKDSEFDAAMYSTLPTDLSATHFTPVDIAIQAAKYLVEIPGTKVLDIGSGAGKFCMIGAACTTGHFTGVELRTQLHDLAFNIAKERPLTNVEFIQSNITYIDFSPYQAFYFYNPFFEQVAPIDSIDDTIVLKKELYRSYASYVKEQLDGMPNGTRLATYFSAHHEVPDSYKILARIDAKKLTFWEKMTF